MNATTNRNTTEGGDGKGATDKMTARLTIERQNTQWTATIVTNDNHAAATVTKETAADAIGGALLAARYLGLAVADGVQMEGGE